MASSPKPPADPLDVRLVRKLADILTETGLSEIEVEKGGLKIRVAKTLGGTMHVAAHAPVAHAPVPAVAPPPPVEVPARAAGEVVSSPMVGTCYLQASPGAAAFVSVGDTVASGQTLLIIEAMKTMNPIAAPRAGKVVEILVADSQPVEFGEPLVVIE